jgi:hypothetical protein
MQEVIEKVKKFVNCAHKKKIVLSGGEQWCEDCGAVGSGAIWKNPQTIEMINQFKGVLGI